jgi:two-component system, cell cycle sensor histidine kinase and response regulator CckA
MGLQIAPANFEESVWSSDPEHAAVGGGETILFVEDEAFVRDVTREVLRSAGYTVLTAKNASEALTAYSSYGAEVKLLLTDVILPGETGRALAAKLQKLNPLLRVLYVTGYADQMADSHTDGADCLPKPFSAGGLLARVRRVLDGCVAMTDTSTEVRRAAGNA